MSRKRTPPHAASRDAGSSLCRLRTDASRAMRFTGTLGIGTMNRFGRLAAFSSWSGN